MEGLAKDLQHLVSQERVKTDPEDLFAYTSDATHYYARGTPHAVVLPVTAEEISRVLKYAFEQTIPVTPRGAGSGLSGGCTPVQGGIVLDMKRMNRIIEINRGNMTARAESGVVLARFQHEVEKEGLFYPPDPQSMTVCTLGGNVATRASGPHGIKYGTTSNYVLGLEVVLPDGSVINTGGTCVKQSVGYNLTQLLTGSEGTLGVITKVNLRVLPLPPAHQTMVVVCESADQAAKIVSEIIAAGTVPAMLEFLSKEAIGLMNTYISPPIITDGEAYLLMDLDGTHTQVNEDAAHVEKLCQDLSAMDIRTISDEKEAQSYWKARSNLGPLILSLIKKMIAEDVTVPRDRIPDFVRSIRDISATTGVLIGISGHAGDGNMHPTILFPEVNEETEKKAKSAIEKIVKTGLELGGTISGEHGIGLHKSEFLEWELGQVQVELLKRIKNAFDPKGIMNPGKIWKDGGGEI
jgi:glycolate oxidase